MDASGYRYVSHLEQNQRLAVGIHASGFPQIGQRTVCPPAGPGEDGRKNPASVLRTNSRPTKNIAPPMSAAATPTPENGVGIQNPIDEGVQVAARAAPKRVTANPMMMKASPVLFSIPTP
jgi:hypothetical protein